MKLTKLFTLFFFALCIISCNTDDGVIGDQGPGDPSPENFSDNFGNSINRDFLGQVIDINSNPIQDVTITIGNTTAMTDNNGIFIINNAPVFERFGYVKAEKVGYIHGSRAVVPSNGTNKVTIMLLEETVIQTINSGETTTVALGSGASASFDGNFKAEDGSDYSGSVDVIMHYLDATDEDMELQMPGMLYAENADGNERMLQTLGMLAVELRGDTGQELNLADGSTSEIRMPLDASLVATAPASIPLWSFDETNGYWKEEGQATLIGNEYVGTVSHFSFWNCDIPAEAINICVTVTDENQNPLANLQVTITSATYGTRGGYTNENGEVCGLIPSNETLTIEVTDFEICGNNPIYSASIGPFSTDSTLDITIQSSTDIISETVTGTFNNCDDDPVTNGYVILTYGAQQFFDTVDNGDFEISMVRCTDDNTFTIEAIDIDAVETSGQINYTFTTPATNLGTINSCDAIDEFITYSINGEPTFLTNISFVSYNADEPQWGGGPVVQIQTDFNNANGCFWLIGRLDTSSLTGTYDLLDSFQSTTDMGFNFIEDCPIPFTTPDANNAITFNLTNLGAVGEYIDVNFSGFFEDSIGVTYTVDGTVHVLRDQ